jgi:hypothetical protein
MIPPAKRGGRRREVNVREVLKAIKIPGRLLPSIVRRTPQLAKSSSPDRMDKLRSSDP